MRLLRGAPGRICLRGPRAGTRRRSRTRRSSTETAEAENANRTQDEPACPVIRFHDLRHTHASTLVSDGRDILFVAKRLGHSNPSFTLARYGHAIPDNRGVEAAEAFARAIDGA